MTGKAPLDLQILIETVHHEYGISLVSLQFLLRGWGGDCYSAVTRDGVRYFLKLHDDATYMGTAATSRAFYLPLMNQLSGKGILPHIPQLVSTKTGALSLQIDLGELVITHFIEADLVGFGFLPDNILGSLAKAVGILHRSRPQLDFEYPLIEQFEIAFETDLVQSFDRVAAITSQDNLGKQLLRQTLLPHKAGVLDALQHLKKLRDQVRVNPKPMVVCHTDLHGGNLMTAGDGTLYILDWENALIAPPEHDLFFFAGETRFREVFLPPYEDQFDPISLNRDVLGFYFYRRALEDIAGFVFRILQGDGGVDRDREDIEWLIGNLEDLATIESNLAKIQTQ